MIEKIYEIYKECFPESLIKKEEFEKKLNLNYSQIIKEFDENNELIGCSIVRENCISLICVKPQFQKKGYGTKLLLESEKMIKENGYSEILLGYKNDNTSLYMGVPILNNDNINFFEKHYYDSDFTSYDINIPVNVQINDFEQANQYSIIDTSKFPDVKNLLFQYLEKFDKKLHDRYYLDDQMNCILCKKGNNLSGVCFYKVYENEKYISIFDIAAYPNFDLNAKKAMLLEIQKIQMENEIENLYVRNVSNPILYQQEFQGNIEQKYWRGSKLC